jgi:hypothetical protein
VVIVCLVGVAGAVLHGTSLEGRGAAETVLLVVSVALSAAAAMRACVAERAVGVSTACDLSLLSSAGAIGTHRVGRPRRAVQRVGAGPGARQVCQLWSTPQAARSVASAGRLESRSLTPASKS